MFSSSTRLGHCQICAHCAVLPVRTSVVRNAPCQFDIEIGIYRMNFFPVFSPLYFPCHVNADLTPPATYRRSSFKILIYFLFHNQKQIIFQNMSLSTCIVIYLSPIYLSIYLPKLQTNNTDI